MKLIRKNKKGFTLVELIVVIAILAILALILIPAITGYIKKAERSSLESSARSLYSQAALIVAEKGEAGISSAEDTELSAGTKFGFTYADDKNSTEGDYTLEVYHIDADGDKKGTDSVTVNQDGVLSPSWEKAESTTP